MKKTLHFMKMGTMLAFLMSIFLFSCTKEEAISVPESEINSELTLKNGHLLPPEEFSCDLMAGQTTNVGNVIYSNDGTNLYVEYFITAPWVVSEIHFYAGTLAGLPRNKTAVQIGHFPYDMSDFDGNKLTIPLDDLDDDSGILTLAFHAVVENGKQNETAWADCPYKYKPVVGAKVRFEKLESDSETKYALTDGPISYADYFNYGGTSWCSKFGLNIYAEGDDYLLQSRHYPLGDAGTVQVSDDGANLKVKIMATDADRKMNESYLFVGSLNQLDAIAIGQGNCPAYADFPYVKFLVGNIHEYSIPFPIISKSFKDAFGSNRWGWISSYKVQ